MRFLERNGDTWRETVLAEAPVPIRSEVVDFDGDGDKDIVVAALGILPPSDELAGKVLLLRQGDDGAFAKETLLEGIGRTTDARAIDVDNDDDLDLVVAIFGGGAVGGQLEDVGALGRGRVQQRGRSAFRQRVEPDEEGGGAR